MTDVEAANQVPADLERSSLEVLKTFVERGATLDAKDKAGDTLLHLAAARSYDTIIQFLADRGMDLNAKNARDLTPLGVSMARRRGVPRATSATSAGSEPAPGAEPPHSSTTALLLALGAK
jgi:ankyrin repeat protein